MMPQSKILVDTNTYLRLARAIRPLLFLEFGEARYCLYILPELNGELSVRRLISKFPWVGDEEYVENRQYSPKVAKKKRKEVDNTFEFVWDYVVSDLPGPSRVDALYVTWAVELSIPVVTDDKDMTLLAEVFGARVMPTLEILRLMLDCGHVSLKTVSGLVDYWRYIDDRPANFHADLKKFFPET
ncbi:DNA-binding protein [Litchfieldella rifensis]|uniref:DNA-binding protein n=1 Tax=Litchfieldella rifensis TaxID=762643 RepID=A0ABV7LIZ0_9GAMM